MRDHGRTRHHPAVLLPARDHVQRKTGHASEQERKDVHAARLARFKGQPDIDPEQLIFIDETWLNTKMARLRGRRPRGERLRVGLPHSHWKTITFIGGLPLTGMDAPMVIDGPINRDLSGLCQTGARGEPAPGRRRDHRQPWQPQTVRDAIEAGGAERRFLPPCSPDFNPIENAFSKLKAILRRIAARTRDDLRDAAADAIETFTPAKCANYCTADGYEPK